MGSTPTEALGAVPLTSGFVKGNRCDLPPVGSKNLLEPQLDQRAARKLIKVFGQKSEDFSQDSRRPSTTTKRIELKIYAQGLRQ